MNEYDYNIGDENWRNSEKMLNVFVQLESGFVACQYDVLLAVECLQKTRKDGVSSDDIEAFCCAMVGY